MKKIYPSCCTSAFCGSSDCTGCKHKPALDSFNAWVKASGAKIKDPVWSPLVYETEEANA